MEDHRSTDPYAKKAGAYATGRTGYAQTVLVKIKAMFPDPASVAVDMGCGTGIFAKALLNEGYTVFGVEPSVPLRDKLVARLGKETRFTSVAATAEQCGLPDACADFVTAASAFHWFDTKAFQKECARILNADGVVFLIINRREEDDALSRDQADVCRRFCPTFMNFHRGSDEMEKTCPSFFSGGYEKAKYDFDLLYTKEDFLARSLSSSYSPVPGDASYDAYRVALAAVIERHAADDRISIRNQTVLWYGKLSTQ